MKCKEIKSLIIASSGGLQDPNQLNAIDSHVEHCIKCSRLKEDMESLRNLMHRRGEPNLPEDLDKKTYLECLSEIHSLQNNKKKAYLQKQLLSIPIYMKVVFISLLVLTVIWIFPVFQDFGIAGEPLSVATIFGLFWIIQNVMMLLFAPLLIRRYQSKKTQNTIFSIGG